jgi:hypothetical protein
LQSVRDKTRERSVENCRRRTRWVGSSLILLKRVTIAQKLVDEFFYLIRRDPGRFFVDAL